MPPPPNSTAKRAKSNTLARRLRTRLLALPGVVESDDVFRDDADAFWCNATEFAYVQDDGSLALRLGRRVYSAHRAELKTTHACAGTHRHQTGSSSRWLGLLTLTSA